MPLTKVDYSKTTIYKIQHRDNDELLYVGSTTDFTRRKYSHKYICNNTNHKRHNIKLYKMIRDNGGFDCFNMTIIKEFPCQNKQEALSQEDKIMRQLKANMNNNKAFRTPEESVEYQKQYRQENQDELTEKRRQRYKLNREKYLEQRKQYYELNREKYLELRKQYYELNKEKILELDKQKMTCECGCVIRRNGFTEHKRTQKHQDLLNMTEQ